MKQPFHFSSSLLRSIVARSRINSYQHSICTLNRTVKRPSRSMHACYACFSLPISEGRAPHSSGHRAKAKRSHSIPAARAAKKDLAGCSLPFKIRQLPAFPQSSPVSKSRSCAGADASFLPARLPASSLSASPARLCPSRT